MKTTSLLLKVLFLILLVFQLLTACEENYYDHVDENLHLVVYKTRADYFNYVNVWGKNVSAPSTLTLEDTNRIAIVGNDTIYKLRWRLEDNYVMDVVINPNDRFTNITFAEIVSYNEKHPEHPAYPMHVIFDRVIDKNPFLEYYRDVNDVFFVGDSTKVEQVNQLIRDGELEKYFKRIK